MNTLQANIERIATELVSNVEDGIESPLRGLGVLTEAINFLTQCRDQIKPIALIEAEKYGEKQFESDGYAIRVTAGRKVWDFKECPTWVEADAKKKDLEKELKLAYQLHEKNPGKTVVDQDGVIELPKVTYTADSITAKPTNK